MTWRPTENLEVGIGVRRIDEETEAGTYYIDHTDGTFDTGGPATEHDFTGRPNNVSPNTYEANDDWDDTIWTGTIKYAIGDTTNAYFNYSEGFRSGGFSIRSARAASEAPFNPETAEQIEIGLKNEFLDGALRLNRAYYELDREGGQFSSTINLPPGSIPGTTTIINNGGKSTTDGSFTVPCEIVDGCSSGLAGQFDPVGTPRELGGNSDSRQPEETYSVRLAYVRDLANGMLSANVGYKHTGEFLLVNTGAGAAARTYDGDYDLVDMAIAYAMNLNNDATLTFTLSGKNLTDEEYREQALFLGGGAFILPSGGPNTGFQGWGAPRTYALEVRYSM